MEIINNTYLPSMHSEMLTPFSPAGEELCRHSPFDRDDLCSHGDEKKEILYCIWPGCDFSQNEKDLWKAKRYQPLA
jgi:hypothetical protein